MKQTHQGCLDRYLKLYLIYTTMYIKIISWCVFFLDQYWSQTIVMCVEASLRRTVCYLQYISGSPMLHLQFFCLPVCEKYDDGTLSCQLCVKGLLLVKVVCLMGIWKNICDVLKKNTALIASLAVSERIWSHPPLFLRNGLLSWQKQLVPVTLTKKSHFLECSSLDNSLIHTNGDHF